MFQRVMGALSLFFAINLMFKLFIFRIRLGNILFDTWLHETTITQSIAIMIVMKHAKFIVMIQCHDPESPPSVTL